MCPNFHATREEPHTTHDRARILLEMLRREVVEGWRDGNVNGAVD